MTTPSRIELRHLRYVSAAADEGSFRRAALRLGVEQSAISRRIRETEEAIGARLFERQSSGVTPTQLGASFVASVNLGLEQIAAAFAQARELAMQGRLLRIGLFGPLTIDFITRLVAEVRRAHPDLRLQFSEDTSLDVLRAVIQGDIDAGVVAAVSPAQGYELMHLWDEPVYLAMAAGDALAAQSSVQWSDLLGRTFLVTTLPTGVFAARYLAEAFGKLGEDVRIERLPITRESLMQLVALGNDLALASSAHMRLAPVGIAFRPIEGAIVPCSLVYPIGPVSRDLQRLLKVAKRLRAGHSDVV